MSPDFEPELDYLAQRTHHTNTWFTTENVLHSLRALAREYLDADKLAAWADTYPEPAQNRKIGVVMAGNVPAVGFHDALSVLISGHVLLAKLSQDDRILIPALLAELVRIEPAFQPYVQFVERLNDADAFIATGSDNSARYFEYYFSKKPNIIRKNRVSVGVLTGHESQEELLALGHDVLQYYGLGCRNIAKLYLPVGYDFSTFYEAIEPLRDYCLNHHKYFNNYEYNKSILLVNGTPHLDNGFLLLTENPSPVSPLAVLYYETYKSLGDVQQLLEQNAEKTQCVVSTSPELSQALPPGTAQQPGLFNYADGVDTMAFLSSL